MELALERVVEITKRLGYWRDGEQEWIELIERCDIYGIESPGLLS